MKDFFFYVSGYEFVVVVFRCSGSLSPVDGVASAGSFHLPLSIGIECPHATEYLERFAWCHEFNSPLRDQLDRNSDESVGNGDEKRDPRKKGYGDRNSIGDGY